MVDGAAELAFMPNAGMEAPVGGELLEPSGDEAVHIRAGAGQINPGMPPAQVVAIGIQDLKKLAAVRVLNQPQTQCCR